MFSPGRLWQTFWRDPKRGWHAAYLDTTLLPLIDQWSWHVSAETSQNTPVHVLTGNDEWRRTAWLLASWFHFTEASWPIVLHDDGTLSEEARAIFRTLFPSARVISRAEADAAILPKLQAFPFCADFRRQHPRALTLFDMPLLARSKRFIVFHTGLLFFNYPREILDWVAAGADECWYQEDAQERSLITAAEARAELDVKIWPRVHSGLGLVTKSATDLDFCDRALAQTSIPTGDPRLIEQTLLMLCAARHGKGGLLPRNYEVSIARHASPEAVSRFYVDHVRDRFYGEGLTRLRDILFPKQA